ncbi:MAG: PEP-CTERM sorting domain-containing protein, partial [Burkholderiaceae bacterium]
MKLAPILVALAATLSFSSAQAVVVNISTQLGANPVQISYGGGYGVGTVLHLDAGSYLVTPVDETFAGAAYTAARRFSSVALPSTGYEWNYYISINGAPGTKHGFGEALNANDGDYTATPAEAFAAAPAPASFTLNNASDMFFYWRDNVWSDNSGGISLNVTAAVPEPGTYALMLAGLLAVGTIARRRRKA